MALLRVAAIGLALALLARPAAADGQREYAVKAAFVYNFARFVSWPETALAPGQPFVVCVVGRNPFGDLLDRAVRDKKVHGRPVVVRAQQGSVEACHLAFLARAGDDPVESLLASAAARHVLTVGEGPEFAARGGAIAMVLEGGRVRFQINLKAVREAGLQVSAELIDVASRVVE